MRLNFDKHFKRKMSDRNFTQRFDVFMTSLSSDNKITVQQCYICGERCDYSLTRDGIRLRVQARFLLSNKQHFVNQTIQFSVAFL